MNQLTYFIYRSISGGKMEHTNLSKFEQTAIAKFLPDSGCDLEDLTVRGGTSVIPFHVA